MNEIERMIQDVLSNKIKDDVYNIIKERNGELDMIDITCHFKHQYTVDVPLMAVQKLKKEGRIEYRDASYCVLNPDRLFVK